jgi:hypothetical protein
MARTPPTPLRWSALTVLVVAAVAAVPDRAHANGDPASDVLLQQDVYYPYAPPAFERLREALDRLLARTREAGYPVKVALIQTPTDLGDLARRFGDPQAYARELKDELTRLRHGAPASGPLHLLVVDPSGLGGTGLGARADKALSEVDVNDAAQSDGLVQAALRAIPRLAALNGTRVTTPPEARIRLAARNEPSERSGPSPLIFFLPVALVVLGALGAGRLAARRRSEPP